MVRDKDGKIYTVRYEAVNAMLLNEFLKEHKKSRNSSNDRAAEEGKLHALHDDDGLTQIQKVSAQLEASKPAPQVVNNP